jgi:Rod binding domain-containing protein
MFITENPTANSMSPVGDQKNVKTDSRAAESSKSEKAREAIEKFESLFLSMMIKELRESGSGEGFFPGDHSDTMGGMFDMYMGDHLAASTDIGLNRLFDSAAGLKQLEEFAGRNAGSGKIQQGIEEYRNEQSRAGIGQLTVGP